MDSYSLLFTSFYFLKKIHKFIKKHFLKFKKKITIPLKLSKNIPDDFIIFLNLYVWV